MVITSDFLSLKCSISFVTITHVVLIIQLIITILMGIVALTWLNIWNFFPFP